MRQNVAGDHVAVISSPGAGVKSDMDPASELAHGALHTSSVDPKQLVQEEMDCLDVSSRCVMTLGVLSWILATIQDYRS